MVSIPLDEGASVWTKSRNNYFYVYVSAPGNEDDVSKSLVIGSGLTLRAAFDNARRTLSTWARVL